MRHKEYLKNIGQKISKIDQETKMKLTEGKALKNVKTILTYDEPYKTGGLVRVRCTAAQ